MDSIQTPTDRVTCTKCGFQTSFPSGYLTEAQKNTFTCEACLQEPVVENRVTRQEQVEGGRRLLTEDLPNTN